ncbi:hypothetical protein [Halomonas piscis]|uniref:hypothetical protein n=1 Tax=Halomonas piscis TaxID=3031727 RepID=UPI0028A11737|nr:hypothetical protein [Halomonas piscis]
MSVLAQIIAYIVSPLATLLAVWVAYLSLLSRYQPQLLIYYQPNPDIPSLIDLVIENIGSGSAIAVAFSKPLPIACFGIEKPEGDGSEVPKKGFPAVASGQRYVFNGGQYAGLESKVGDGLEVRASYKFRNPIGFLRTNNVTFVLGIDHLQQMPTQTSANQAVVDALKGPNKTTIQEIRDELRTLNRQLRMLGKRDDAQNGDVDA